MRSLPCALLPRPRLPPPRDHPSRVDSPADLDRCVCVCRCSVEVHASPRTVSDPQGWDLDDVSVWVTAVGLHEYRGALREGRVDGPRLLTLTVEQMEEEFLIASAE